MSETDFIVETKSIATIDPESFKKPEGESNILSALTATAGAGELVTGVATKALASAATSIFGRGMATNAIPVIGQILSAGMILHSIFKAFGGGNKDQIEAEVQAKNEQARREYEAEQQARQDLKQKCLHAASELEDSLKAEIGKLIVDMMKSCAEPFKAKIATMEAEGKNFVEDLSALNQIRDEYHALLTELGEKASANA